MLGYPFLLLYDFGASTLRARGDSRYPFFALMVSGAANVGFNLLFVVVFRMDVAGSTIAMNFEYFTYYIITAFGQTAATFTSQNFAAAQLERCRRILRLCLVSSTVCSSIPIFTIVMLRSLFSGIFTTSAASLPTLYHAFPLSWAATIVLVNLGFLILHPLKDSGAVNNRAFNH